MKTIDQCPICANPALVPNAKVAFSAPFLQTEAGHTNAPGQTVSFLSSALVQYSLCLRCGAYIQNPRMEDADVEKYYSTGLYRAWLNMPQEEMDNDEQHRANYLVPFIKQHIGDVRRHLDVGASRGYLLRDVNSEYRAGVEPNLEYVQVDGPIYYTNLDDIPVSETFDLVTCIHVLEHTLSPLNELAKMGAHVATGGKLLIEVPSEQSPGGWARLAHTYHLPSWTLHHMARMMGGWRVSMVALTPHTLAVFERL